MEVECINMHKYKLRYIFTSICIVVILIGYYLSTNINFLMLMLGGEDVPSYAYSFTIRMIYKQCQNPQIRRELLDDFKSGRRGFLVDKYIDILGVIGDVDATGPIIAALISAVNKREKSTIFHAINSLGIIGDSESEVLLKRLCDKYDSYQLLNYERSALSRAIYLMSGNIYTCPSSDVNRFIVTDDMLYARTIIMSSRSRYHHCPVISS